MAYKFQLGAFTASGSIKAEEGFDANDQNVVNVGALEADAIQPDGSTLALKGGVGNTDQMILDGSIVEAKTAFRMSGSQQLQFASADDSIGMASDFSSLDIKSIADIKLSGAIVQVENHNGVDAGLQLGGTLVTATAAEINELDGFAAATYAVANDSIVFLDSDGGIRTEENGDFLTAISAEGLEVNANQLRVKRANDGALTFIGGGNDELSVLLSGSSLTKDADGLKLSDTIPGNRTFSNNVTINGDLLVSGTTVEIDAAFVVTSSIQFEGSTPDGNELTLTTADPTAARTVTIPDLSGHVPLLAGAVADSAVTSAEFGMLDASARLAGGYSTATIHSTQDGFLFNNNGTLEHLRADKVAEFVGNNFAETVQTITATTATIDMANGAQVLANPSAEQTLTLPAPSDLRGKMLKIKLINGDYKVNISANGSENIDGQSGDIVLESGYAGVSIISDGTNYFVM